MTFAIICVSEIRTEDVVNAIGPLAVFLVEVCRDVRRL